MPIKFRCGYCRQFLGISRSKAGDVVDCPSCGRTIRVPGLDGAASPVPHPELDLQDSQLAKALDVLAGLNSPQQHMVSTEFPTSLVDAPEAESIEREDDIPQPIPEPIPIEVAIAPQPVVLQPKPLQFETNGLSSAEAPFNEAALQQELARLLPPVGSESSPSLGSSATPSFAASPSKATSGAWWLGILISFFAGIGGAAGYFTMNSRSGTVSPAPQKLPEIVVKGRISYSNENGEQKPDSGARVFVVPEDRRGTIKLGPVGLQATDDAIDRQAVAAVFSALGGGFTTTNDRGEFAIPLSQTGAYRVVVFSRFKERPEGTPLDGDVLQILGRYLDDPATIAGRVQFLSAPLSVKDSGETTWDHVFR